MRSGSVGKIQNCALENRKFAHNSAPEKGLTETKICSETTRETPVRRNGTQTRFEIDRRQELKTGIK